MNSEEEKAPWWPALTYIVLTPVFVVWRAYALSLLWAWLVVPTFAVQSLSVAQTAAITFALHAFTYRSEDKPEEAATTERLAAFIVHGALLPPGLLLFGWIYRSFLVGAP